jgi:hypothetical protein
MARKHSVHVVPYNGGWAVKQEGVEQPVSEHPNRKEAITAAQDLALDEETDLVIHRKDGQFDEVVRAEQLQEKTADRAELRRSGSQGPLGDLHARDLFSTGSRVSWSAILAGLVLTLAVYAALSVLGVAVGLSVESELKPGELAVGGLIWALVSLLIALFLGGFVTSRTTVGENPGEAMTYGLILWGALFVLMLHLTSIGLNIGVGQMLRVATGAQDARYAAPAGLSPEVAGALGGGPEVIDRPATPGISPTAEAATISPGRATEAAWWTFAAIILSMLAAVGGSIVGAGPQMVLKGIRERGFLTVRPEPVTAHA